MGGSPVQDGVYNLLVLGTQQALTLPPNGPPPFGAAAHLPPQWTIKGLSNGNVTIQRGDEGLYLGYQSDQPRIPRINAFCIGVKNPVEWQLRQGPEENTFQVVIPGGPLPDEGVEACLDHALIMIFPPPTALRPLNSGNGTIQWTFVKV
ncbi:hypothetical protein M422DRAFT_250154 [Sphaerobolus stellatus SS14]|nr:hypothetical protein M422DRAFT_250154 [Sphaerobolus stellatus SS14]